MDKELLNKIKELKNVSQASIELCKKALITSNGDFDKALVILEENNKDIAKKRSGKGTSAGCVASYTHKAKENSPQSGALVQVECETTFVSKRPEFLTMSKNLAVHITNSNPKYVSLEDISKQEWEKEILKQLEILKESNHQRSEEELKKIAEEKANEALKEDVLLLQPFALTPNLTVQEYIDSFVGLFRENIKIKRFVRFSIE